MDLTRILNSSQTMNWKKSEEFGELNVKIGKMPYHRFTQKLLETEIGLLVTQLLLLRRIKKFW